MEERIPLLRGKVGAEATAMDKKLQELLQEWEAGRPLSKDHTPAEVTSSDHDRHVGHVAGDFYLNFFNRVWN